MNLKNAVVVITGGSSGLGRAMAETFCKNGAKVMISSKEGEKLTKTAQELGVESFAADVTKKEDMKALAGKAVETFGRIDIWVNNAGIWLPKMPFLDADLAKAHEIFEVNLFGAMNGALAAFGALKANSGTLLNVVSTSALRPRPLQAIYSSSKHAQKGFVDAIREEWREEGVNVLGVYPGGIKTELFRDARPEDYEKYMDPYEVAGKIIANIEKDKPDEELVIERK